MVEQGVVSLKSPGLQI